MTISTVGFVGMGKMGSRMAPHIASAGFPVHVFDLKDEAAEAVARAHNGIVVEKSAKAVAAASDAVVTMLPAGPDVRLSALGADGLAEGFGDGGVVIDMSSSQPWMTVELAEALSARGIAMIEAPVSGGIDGAEAGTLTLMVGGDPEVVERCRPVLEPMAGNIYYAGASGSGHALKTLNNMLSGLNTMAATEAMLIGTRFGLDPDTMVDVISKSTGMNGAIVRTMKQQVISRKFGGGFAWDLKFKDFKIAMELAHRTNTSVPLSALAFELNQAANIWMGDTTGKTSAEIVRWMEAMAGSEIAKGDDTD
ncbi:MAG: NAD(P)-dependent oxidoreductase [Alphaproteobacteria bacterium]|nr:NAD(P)-dependent oxidoreductase [Alphaproteobacteria bacterium]